MLRTAILLFAFVSTSAWAEVSVVSKSATATIQVNGQPLAYNYITAVSTEAMTQAGLAKFQSILIADPNAVSTNIVNYLDTSYKQTYAGQTAYAAAGVYNVYSGSSDGGWWTTIYDYATGTSTGWVRQDPASLPLSSSAVPLALGLAVFALRKRKLNRI